MRGDLGTACVDVLQKGLHGFGKDAVDLHQHLAALAVVIAEHSTEVAATCRENGAVAVELPALHTDHHVGEEAVVTELIEGLKDALAMQAARAKVVGVVMATQVLRVHLKHLALHRRGVAHSRVLPI